jgi:hypothetical protein
MAGEGKAKAKAKPRAVQANATRYREVVIV